MASIAGLQQGLGNRGMSRLIAQLKRDPSKPIQRMGGPEEEELQMKRDPSKAIQREAEGPELEEEELQMKRDPSAAIQREAEGPELEEEELQMKRDPSDAIQREAEGPELEDEELQMKRDPSKPVQRKSNGIPDGVLQKMEASFGTSFADVNIHEGSQAADVGALAYTQGSDIHFAPGKFQPDSKSGQELLGHELAHVVQQREGRVKPNAEVAGVPLNDDKALEAEADRLGSKAASGR
jgi:hypothetical protein